MAFRFIENAIGWHMPFGILRCHFSVSKSLVKILLGPAALHEVFMREHDQTSSSADDAPLSRKSTACVKGKNGGGRDHRCARDFLCGRAHVKRL